MGASPESTWSHTPKGSSSAEIIYYVAGNFMGRRGVEISSLTLHPGGIPHGPHPGTVEASIGKEGTEELAVMVDTFHPLNLTREATRLEDERYPYSWLPPENPDEHAAELAERGPEAFPVGNSVASWLEHHVDGLLAQFAEEQAGARTVAIASITH